MRSIFRIMFSNTVGILASAEVPALLKSKEFKQAVEMIQSFNSSPRGIYEWNQAVAYTLSDISRNKPIETSYITFNDTIKENNSTAIASFIKPESPYCKNSSYFKTLRRAPTALKEEPDAKRVKIESTMESSYMHNFKFEIKEEDLGIKEEYFEIKEENTETKSDFTGNRSVQLNTQFYTENIMPTSEEKKKYAWLENPEILDSKNFGKAYNEIAVGYPLEICRFIDLDYTNTFLDDTPVQQERKTCLRISQLKDSELFNLILDAMSTAMMANNALKSLKETTLVLNARYANSNIDKIDIFRSIFNLALALTNKHEASNRNKIKKYLMQPLKTMELLLVLSMTNSSTKYKSFLHIKNRIFYTKEALAFLDNVPCACGDSLTPRQVINFNPNWFTLDLLVALFSYDGIVFIKFVFPIFIKLSNFYSKNLAKNFHKFLKAPEVEPNTRLYCDYREDTTQEHSLCYYLIDWLLHSNCLENFAQICHKHAKILQIPEISNGSSFLRLLIYLYCAINNTTDNYKQMNNPKFMELWMNYLSMHLSSETKPGMCTFLSSKIHNVNRKFKSLKNKGYDTSFIYNSKVERLMVSKYDDFCFIIIRRHMYDLASYFYNVVNISLGCAMIEMNTF